MRRSFPLLLLAILAVSALRTVSGQVCLGYAPFSSGPVRASVGYQDASRTDQFRGEVGYGFNHSDFGVLGYQHTATRNTDGGFGASANAVDGMVGREFSLGGSSAKLCPIGRLGYYSSSSTFSSGNSSTAHGPTYDFGGAFGFNATDGPTHVVPSLAVEYFGSYLNGSTTINGQRQSVSFAGQRFTQWTLALGVQAHGVTIAPYINGRFSRGGVGGFWGVNAAINFGTLGR
jgi:hypothetical protein